jgi:hypothetical protein
MFSSVWMSVIFEGFQSGLGMKFYTFTRLGVRATVPSFNYKAQRSVSTAFDNSFGVKAARLWNILPKEANSQSTLDEFKVALGAFIQRPALPGYAANNGVHSS